MVMLGSTRGFFGGLVNLQTLIMDVSTSFWECQFCTLMEACSKYSSLYKTNNLYWKSSAFT